MKLHPIHKTRAIEFFSVSTGTALELPFIDEGIKAGFPSPANDFIDASIDLNNKLVVVLSNNDGCVIARSNEAKKIGIPMGAPAFEYKHLFNKYNVDIFAYQ